MKRIAISILILLGATSARADEVHTADGFVLQGTVSAMNADTLTIQTGPFGALTVARTNITDLSIQKPTIVRLEDNSLWIGKLKTLPNGTVEIRRDLGQMTVPQANISELWPDGTEDPRISRKKEQEQANRKKWKTELAATFNTTSGNSTKANYFADLRTTRRDASTVLNLYSRYRRGTRGHIKTKDEHISGWKYNTFTYDSWGWYNRSEFEMDEFENIDLRTTLAGGLTYRWANKKHYKLSGEAGSSYRHEAYTNGEEDFGVGGLDFGLDHFYRFKNNWEIKTELNLLPTLADFQDYLFTQESSLSMPLTDSNTLKVKLGLINDYNSQPDQAEKLDTTFYGALTISPRPNSIVPVIGRNLSKNWKKSSTAVAPVRILPSSPPVPQKLAEN